MIQSSLNNQVKQTVTVGRICFANTDPIYYGIDNGLKPSWLDIITAPPSVLNRMFSKGKLDISPVSSVAYAEHSNEWLLLPDISISCLGDVLSVLLVSKYPFEKLHNKNIILTDESASAAKLVKLFFTIKKITPLFKQGAIKHSGDIPKNVDALLVIGDTALKGQWETRYKYVWDLSGMWEKNTGLPFIFSVWAVHKKFAYEKPEIVTHISNLFQLSKKAGKEKIEEIAISCSKKIMKDTNFCINYYNKLCYDMKISEINGLNAFFDALLKNNMIKNKIKLTFFNHKDLRARSKIN